MNYKLSPSDLTFLYESCKRCFYFRVVHSITQPSIPLPSIFSRIANLLKDYYDGKRTSELHNLLPPGIISHGEQYVKSTPIHSANRQNSCYINGRFDIVVSFDDGTYGVIDFKTGSPKEESTSLYSRQLHAYAYALEHPAPGALRLAPVTKLGLLYFYPSGISQTNNETLSYTTDITLIEINKDEQGFLQFMDEVLGIVEAPQAPELSRKCPWCGYIGKLSNSVPEQAY